MLFIPISQLKSGMKLAHNVLVFEQTNVRLLNKGMVLSQQFIDGLVRFGITGVYVKDDITGDILPSRPLLNQKLKTSSLNDLEWVFRHSAEDSEKSGKKHIEHLDKTVLELVDLVRDNKSRLVNIADLKAYDEYTYHHSLSVAIISIAIGMQSGMTQSELHKLGFSAIMHDIGKMNVPIEIINKPDRLTANEFDIIKGHPKFSEVYLLQNSVVDPDIYESVVHHHEKLDGTGYPDHLREKDIPFFSKIISVADVYDALTSHRPYRDPMQPAPVTEYIMGSCGAAFDMDVIRAFLEKIEFYPVGSFVELNHSAKAVVIDNEHSLHPVVRMLEPPFATLDLFSGVDAYRTVITRLYDDFQGEGLGLLTV